MINSNIEIERNFFSGSFKNWLKEDYYSILGIHSNSSIEEINSAFKKIIKTANPHNYKENSIERKYAEIKLKHLIEIREILTDTYKRSEYDFNRQLSQDCYLDYMISSSRLSNNKNKSAKIDKNKTDNILKNYIRDDMRFFHISESEVKILNEIYQFCKSTTLLN